MTERTETITRYLKKSPDGVLSRKFRIEEEEQEVPKYLIGEIVDGIKLSMDLVLYILQYDDRFVIRNGKLSRTTRISMFDERYDMLNQVCQDFIYNPERDFDNVLIDLPINRNKSYTIEMRFIHYIYKNQYDDEEEDSEIGRFLTFHRSGCDSQLLCEY